MCSWMHSSENQFHKMAVLGEKAKLDFLHLEHGRKGGFNSVEIAFKLMSTSWLLSQCSG